MTKANEDRLSRIERALESLGNAVNALAGRTMQGKTLLRVDRQRADKDDPNYIAIGSPEHARFLGLVEVITEQDRLEAEAAFVTYEDPRDGKVWRTYDEEAPLRWYPGIEPEKAIRRVIVQKLNVLYGGAGEPPPGTPELWQPNPAHEAAQWMGISGPVEFVDGDETVTVFTPWQSIV